jgi:NADH:ubiquinone oxidoreductase subunit 3 (subunit A)
VLQLAFSSTTLISEPQLTVLEAGFERLKGRVVLSSSFFSLVALFVLFDIELILLFPGVLFHPFLGRSNFFYLFLLLVVLISLLFE